jgi:hypothetical protein
MSWASNRKTTRAEDTAYCLMGLFNINMPMLYGEGDRAFLRLQEEIIKYSDDLSLFAWTTAKADFSVLCGLFAPSPSVFSTCGETVWTGNDNKPHEMTNKGIKLYLKLDQTSSGASLEYKATLEGVIGYLTANEPAEDKTPIAICLTKINNQYQRVDTHQLTSAMGMEKRVPHSTVYVRQAVETLGGMMIHPRIGRIEVRLRSEDEFGLELVGGLPTELWNSNESALRNPPSGEGSPLPHATFMLNALRVRSPLDVNPLIASFRIYVDPAKPWEECLRVEVDGQAMDRGGGSWDGAWVHYDYHEGVSTGWDFRLGITSSLNLVGQRVVMLLTVYIYDPFTSRF